MLQFTDTVLDAALAPGQERTIRPLLQVDWLKDGSFISSASQLTSDNLIQVDCVDDVDSGLPDDVTGRPTASSTTLTATLHGYVGDLPLWQLFSAWNRDSPYHGIELTGAAVQYSVATSTPGGETTTRRFTGWVDTVKVDRVQGTVTVTAANNLHLLGHQVSLPRWCRATDIPGYIGLPHVDRWDIPNEDRMENAPLSAAYLVQNVMRQCKAVPGPDPRSDSIWFSSGYGGMIPELGVVSNTDASGYVQSQGLAEYVYPQNWGAPNYNRDILSYGELGFPSPYANAQQASGVSSNIFDTYSQSAATIQFRPNASFPRYLNGGVWARIPSGDSGSFVQHNVWLEQNWIGLQADLAQVEMNVGASTTYLKVKSTTSGGTFRQLTIATPTTKDTLIYVSWEMDLANPGNMKIWYNNVQQTGTLTGTLTTYPTIDTALGGDITTAGIVEQNKIRVWCRHAAFVNAEVWLNNTAQVGSTRVQTWTNAPYTRKDFAIINGGILGAQVYRSDALNNQNWAEGAGSMPAVTHIPVRERVDAWELLKEICAAFLMTMWIDAYGGLRIIPQAVLSILEKRLTDPRKKLDGDSLQGVSLNMDFDSVRDKIIYGGQTARRTRSTVYQASDARQFYAPAGTTTEYTIGLPDTAVGTPAYRNTLNVFGLGGNGQAYNVPQNNWQNSGFMATEEDGDAGTNTAVWPVACYLINVGLDQGSFGLRIVNSHTQKIYLAMATGSTPGNGPISSPALLVPGGKKVLAEPLLYSQGTGNRLLQIQISPFHSAPWTMDKTIAALLERTSQSVPRAEDLTLPGDPRREVYDTLDLHDPDGGVATAISQIVGRSDTWASSEGYTQRLTIRLIFPPDAWLMEIDGFSEIELTTYVG